MSDTSAGILALWHDCEPEQEAAFEEWYQTEHMDERLSIPGFLHGRRYEAVEGSPGYFTCYNVTDPAVFASEAYQVHADAPTPMTRNIMTSGAITNMSRTVCKVAYRRGAMRGAFAVTAVLQTAGVDVVFEPVLDELVNDPGVARAEYWINAEASNAEASVEEQLRGGDDKVAACVFIETLRLRDATKVQQRLADAGSAVIRPDIYRYLCDLDTQADRP